MLKIERSEDKIRGALYGFAIGDAMGATTEYMEPKEIKEKYGILDDMVGGGCLALDPGQVTSNTHMMICVMEALRGSTEVGSGTDGIDYFHNLLGNNLVEYICNITTCNNVSGQCIKGILHYMRYGKQIDVKDDECDSGGLVRALPCAMIGKFDLNLVQNSFTHGNKNVCHILEGTTMQ